MLLTSLLPLLTHYSLGFDLAAGPDETVTLTIIPRKAEGAKRSPESAETRPISITATAAEIDAELAKGADGALGRLIAARKALGDQLAEQHEAAEAAKAAAKEAAKSKAKPVASSKAAAASASPQSPPPSAPPAEAKPGEPASLW